MQNEKSSPGRWERSEWSDRRMGWRQYGLTLGKEVNHAVKPSKSRKKNGKPRKTGHAKCFTWLVRGRGPCRDSSLPTTNPLKQSCARSAAPPNTQANRIAQLAKIYSHETKAEVYCYAEALGFKAQKPAKPCILAFCLVVKCGGWLGRKSETPWQFDERDLNQRMLQQRRELWRNLCPGRHARNALSDASLR
jgi:hypothetical protein